MKLGVITTGLVQHEFEHGLDVARDLGFATIELGCAGFHSKRYCDPEVLLADAGAFDRWRAAFEDRSLEISALAVHGAPLSPDPDEAARYEREFRDACRLAERLGVDRLTLLAGIPEGTPGDRTPSWIVDAVPAVEPGGAPSGSGRTGSCRTGGPRARSRATTAAACASR